MLSELIAVMVAQMMKKNTIRTYSELSKLDTFEDRYNYLKLDGVIGEDTFGFQRWLNQVFYKSREWLSIRREVIIRDNGCDLGLYGYDISGRIIVHHMNPITPDDIRNRSIYLLNPEYLISTAHLTHEAITYGSDNLLPKTIAERTQYDTCPWRR